MPVQTSWLPLDNTAQGSTWCFQLPTAVGQPPCLQLWGILSAKQHLKPSHSSPKQDSDTSVYNHSRKHQICFRALITGIGDCELGEKWAHGSSPRDPNHMAWLEHPEGLSSHHNTPPCLVEEGKKGPPQHSCWRKGLPQPSKSSWWVFKSHRPTSNCARWI